MEESLGQKFQSMKPSLTGNRLGKYGFILVAVKVIRCVGLFECYDLLKNIHILYFLFFIKACSGGIFTLLQKPFFSGPRIQKRQWLKITRYAIIGIFVNLLWLLGLTLCGPLRTILLFEHSEVVIVSMLTGIFTSTKNHSKTRGAVFFIVAVLCLLTFDNDDEMQKLIEHPEGEHVSTLLHGVYWFITAIGVADHKGGILLLVLTLLLKVAHSVVGKKLAMDIGGEKRLHALSCVVSTIILSPFVIVLYFTSSSSTSIMSYAVPFTLVVVLVFVTNFYLESFAAQKYDASQFSRVGYFSISITALILAYFWQHPAAVAISKIHGKNVDTRTSEHVMSGGVLISASLFLIASSILSRPSSKGSTGSFIGYSADGLPLYNFAGSALQRATQFHIPFNFQSFLKTVLKESDSRHLFYFLCINLAFAFVELFYGLWSNSLGLVSDSFHMLFDCTALVLGLLASIMAKWKPTRVFSYGYGRVEILSGFVNALFLLVVATFLLVEAFQRLFDPPTINTDRLMVVSVGGLLVNIFGVMMFTHSHNHHGHSHDHGHSHKHECDHHEHDNANIRGVYLHILADLMGSVGVIISSFLIGRYGLYISDPICTLLIAIMILTTIWPLLRDSVRVLVLRLPLDIEKNLHHELAKVQSIQGVVSLRSFHFWKHSNKDVIGVISIQVSPHVIEQRIISQVTPILKDVGITHLTVQVEKEDFYQHISGLATNTDELYQMIQQQHEVSEDKEYAKLV